MSKSRYLFAAVALIAAILACNWPSPQPNQQEPGAILTAAALTVQAQLPVSTTTQPPSASLPPAVTSTFTPLPLPTAVPATPTSNCNNAQFITDVTYPDNTVVPSGDNFTKTWRLKNIGTCSWTPSYAVIFFSGDSMNGPAVQALAGNVNPGQTIDISVNLTAPTSNGTYTGYWKLRNASGVTFAQFYVQIKVGSGGGGPFAVTSVNMTVTGSCGNFHTAVSITTNGAGTVKYHKIFSDGGTDSLPGTMVFASAGTQSFNFDNSMSAAHTTTWIDIYIDSPNHQQFGRATYTCP